MITRITQSAKTVAKHRAISFTVTSTYRGPQRNSVLINDWRCRHA